VDWHNLLAAFAIFLILEGLLPFLSPPAFKNYVQKMLAVSDSALRYMGLGSMIAGVVLLYIVRN